MSSEGALPGPRVSRCAQAGLFLGSVAALLQEAPAAALKPAFAHRALRGLETQQLRLCSGRLCAWAGRGFAPRLFWGKRSLGLRLRRQLEPGLYRSVPLLLTAGIPNL